jgi:Tfp pilus assembly protein PilN
MTQQINLVDLSLLPVRERLSGKTLLVALAAGAGVLTAHYAFESWRMQQARAENLAVSNDAAAVANGTTVPDNPLAEMQEQLSRGEALLNALSRGNDLPVDTARLMQQVTKALPDTVWLTELEVNGPRSLQMAGGTLDAPSLADFSVRLGGVPALKGVPIEVIRLEPEPRTEGTDTGSPDTASGPVPYVFLLASGDARPQGAAP